jgi:hypothetical protein
MLVQLWPGGQWLCAFLSVPLLVGCSKQLVCGCVQLRQHDLLVLTGCDGPACF